MGVRGWEFVDVESRGVSGCEVREMRSEGMDESGLG